MPTAAVYLRVSTEEQHPENQRAEVEQLARARGFEPVFYEERESAAKDRPVLAQVMEAARRGRVTGIVVWAIDRLDRSMVGVVQRVLELDALGVRVLSVRESWLDTAGPVRSLLLAIFGWVAEQERARLIERTRAGIARARERGTKSGKAIGRPRVDPERLALAAAYYRQEGSTHRAAHRAGVGEATLRRFLASQAAPGTTNAPADVSRPPPAVKTPSKSRPGRRT